MSPGEAARRAHREVLARDPRHGTSLRALHRAYRDARLHDEAWCVAETLVFVGEADREAERDFERGRLDEPIRPKAPLTDEHWLKRLRHPTQSLVVSKIFQQLWPAILGLRGKTDRDAGLAPKYLVDPAQSTVTLARTFGFAAQVLGIQAPRLYLRQDVQGGLTTVPVWPLASLAGATLLQGFEARALLFVTARHLADYRGEHYLRTLVPSPEQLRAMVLATLRLADRFPEDPWIDQIARELLRKLGPAQVAALGTLCRRLVEEGRDIDLRQWLRAVELTACRAGLLICDDLATAAEMIRALGRTGPVDVPPQAKIDELVRFAISDDYFALRRALGIALRVG